MSPHPSRKSPIWPSALALVASILGFSFALSSTLDYARHLDRQVHDLHCSFVPGLGADAAQEGACRAAMYSPYSALFKDRYWGGVPISLFAVGAFGFFAAFSLYLLFARDRAPRRAQQFLFLAGITPLLVSAVMFVISVTKIGAFCKTCVGIYVSSLLLAIAGVAALLYDRRRAREALEVFRGVEKPVFPPAEKAAIELEARERGVAPTVIEEEVPAVEAPKPEKKAEAGAFTPPRTGGPALVPAWLLALAVFSVVPALLYVSAMPSYATYVTGCGKLEKMTEPNNALIHVAPAGARQQATMFVDPLCPTCKAFHQRLVADGIFDKLDTTLVLFPLDNECNWMLDRPLHPGACVVSKAVLCADKDQRALAVLEWSYDHQEELLDLAKGSGGIAAVRGKIREKFPGLDACIDSKDTKLRLDRTLRYIVSNQLPVSTPQLFLDGTRLCDEDSDIGLSYTITKLAPELGRSR
jgi:uncharacterized membrane protein